MLKYKTSINLYAGLLPGNSQISSERLWAGNHCAIPWAIGGGQCLDFIGCASFHIQVCSFLRLSPFPNTLQSAMRGISNSLLIAKEVITMHGPPQNVIALRCGMYLLESMLQG